MSEGDGMPQKPDTDVFESIDDMLANDDIEIKKIPAWKRKDGTQGHILIASLTAGDMIEFVEANEGPAKRTAGLRLIIKSLVNSKGERIGKMTDIERLKTRNSRITNQIVDEILKLNGLDKKSQDESKNASGEASTDASPTGSPSKSVH